MERAGYPHSSSPAAFLWRPLLAEPDRGADGPAQVVCSWSTELVGGSLTVTSGWFLGI